MPGTNTKVNIIDHIAATRPQTATPTEQTELSLYLLRFLFELVADLIQRMEAVQHILTVTPHCPTCSAPAAEAAPEPDANRAPPRHPTPPAGLMETPDA